MGKGIIMRSGGGVDLSAVTAGANDVLSGKVIVDKDGNAIAGRIQKQGAMTFNAETTQKTIAVNGKYMMGNITIPGVPLPPADIIKEGEVYTGAGGSKVTGIYKGTGLEVKYYYSGYIHEPGYADFTMTSNDFAIVMSVLNGDICLDIITLNDDSKWISDGWLEVQISGNNVRIYNYDESGVYGDIEIYVLPNQFTISDRLYW